MHSRAMTALVLATLVGCMRADAPESTPPPTGVDRLAIAPPTNRTGHDIVLDQPGFLGKTLLHEKRATLPAALAEDLRVALVDRGFKIVAAPSTTSPTLQTEIRRWEPYSADYSMVVVDVTASLVEPSTGRQLWSTERSGWRVPTRDAHSTYEASTTASRAIAEALVSAWEPAARKAD
jgi:hypothetical protein